MDDDWDDDTVWMDRTGPHFRDDIIAMKDRTSPPCDFVSVPFIYVDYRALEEDQLNYYLYWRERFWEGEMLRTCEGYLWLLANEIGVLGCEPERTYDLLMRLWDERRYDLFDPSLFTEFVRDFSIQYNLPRPPCEEFGCDRNESLVGLITCRPGWYMGARQLSELTGGIGIMKDESETICKVVDVSLRRLNIFLGRNAKDLIGTYSRSNIETVHELYRDYPLLKGKKVSVDCPNLYHENNFRILVRNVTRYTASRIRGLRIADRPSDLSDLMMEIIDYTYENIDEVPDYDPSKAATKVKDVQDRYVARGLHPSVSTEVKGGQTLNMMIDRNLKVQQSSASKLVRNWITESDEPCRYVPSDYVNPSYDTMDDEQYDYYIYWRSQVRKGVFLETDNGYIRFLVTEIVSCSDDPKEAVRLLEKLRDTYQEPNLRKFIDTAIMEYSIIFGLPIKDTKGAYESLLNAIALSCLSSDPIKDMPMDALASVAGVDADSVSRLGKEGLAAVNSSLREIDRERRALGMLPTVELFNVQRNAHSAFYTIRRDFPAPLYNSSYQSLVVKRNTALRIYIANTIRLVFQYMDRFSGKKVAVKIPKYHGERTLKIIEGSVLKAFGLDPKGKKRLELDGSALKSAQDDLKAVTEMMSSVDEAIEEVPEETEIETGWDALAKNLDEMQIRYLTEALDSGSRCASIAKEAHLTVVKMEDSINSVSMDAIGDTIVENQSVVEDYYDDVTAMVQRH